MNYFTYLSFFHYFVVSYEYFVESLVLKTIPEPFCYLCDSSPNATINNSKQIGVTSFKREVLNDHAFRRCYPNGIYDDFCSPRLKRMPYDCVSYISILPPVLMNARCKVEILSNNGSLEETLIFTRNVAVRNTYNTWNITQSRRKPLMYTVNRKLSSNDIIRGKTLKVQRLNTPLASQAGGF